MNLLASGYLVVSLATLTWQSAVLAHLLRRRNLVVDPYALVAYHGLIRTAIWRAGVAVAYVIVASITLFRREFPTVSILVFAAIQTIWMGNAAADARLRKRLAAWPDRASLDIAEPDTTLSEPYIYNQVIQPDADARELCGECMLASALSWVGIPTTPEDVATAIRAEFGGTSATQYGTDQNQLGWYCTQKGLYWSWQMDGKMASVLASLKHGFPVGVVIKDNSHGDPSASGDFRHWILVWRDNGDGTVECGNSWPQTDTDPTGRILPYSVDELNAVFIESLEIRKAGTASTISLPAPMPGGSDMIATRPNGGFSTSVRGMENEVYHQYSPDAAGIGIANWESLGGVTLQQPAVAWSADGRTCVVVCVGTDTNLYRKIWTQTDPNDPSGGKWEAEWTKLNGQSPSPVTTPPQ